MSLDGQTAPEARGLRAMCIDDDIVDQKLNLRSLTRSGAFDEILQFTDAELALDHLSAHPDAPVDVIFLDVNMPRMTGFEFLEAATAQLGEHFVEIVVIMLTTSLNPHDQAQARQFRAVKDFRAKPLRPEDAQAVAHRVRMQTAD